MFFSRLSYGFLLRRYKRFLADIRLPNGEQLTIHCPNTGAMTGCANEGDRVWFSTSENPNRKYAHTWEFTETKAGHFICVNTQRANQLVKEALQQKQITEFTTFDEILPEVTYGTEKSRIDFLLKKPPLVECFIEVKSTTLLTDNGVGMFPDAKTERGQKHLRELTNLVKDGKQAVIFFVILHTGINSFEVAKQIDPQYAKLFEIARKCGVEALAYQAEVEINNQQPVGMKLIRRIAIN